MQLLIQLADEDTCTCSIYSVPRNFGLFPLSNYTFYNSIRINKILSGKIVLHGTTKTLRKISKTFFFLCTEIQIQDISVN
jgi:hypothetical protein